MFCAHCVETSLAKLCESDSHPKLSITAAKQLLVPTWNLKEIDFFNGDGDRIHGRTFLENMLREPFTVRLLFEADCNPSNQSLDSVDESGQHDNEADVVSEEKDFPHALQCNALTERFVRAIDLQHHRRGFVWIKYVKDTLLPNFGLDGGRSQELLDRMIHEGLLFKTQSPSPKSPGFVSVGVELNREHPIVRRILGNNGKPMAFKPVPIRGEPASKTLIRERR